MTAEPKQHTSPLLLGKHVLSWQLLLATANGTGFAVFDRIMALGACFRQMSPGAATPDAIESAGRCVTRNLPEAHWWTKSLRQPWFNSAAHRLRDLVFRVDPVTLSDEAFEQIQKATELGIKAIEVHILASGDTVTLRNVLIDLRAALEGLECGLPADPAKRPTREEMTRIAGERMLASLIDRAS